MPLRCPSRIVSLASAAGRPSRTVDCRIQGHGWLGLRNCRSVLWDAASRAGRVVFEAPWQLEVKRQEHGKVAFENDADLWMNVRDVSLVPLQRSNCGLPKMEPALV